MKVNKNVYIMLLGLILLIVPVAGTALTLVGQELTIYRVSETNYRAIVTNCYVDEQYVFQYAVQTTFPYWQYAGYFVPGPDGTLVTFEFILPDNTFPTKFRFVHVASGDSTNEVLIDPASLPDVSEPVIDKEYLVTLKATPDVITVGEGVTFEVQITVDEQPQAGLSAGLMYFDADFDQFALLDSFSPTDSEGKATITTSVAPTLFVDGELQLKADYSGYESSVVSVYVEGSEPNIVVSGLSLLSGVAGALTFGFGFVNYVREKRK